MRLRASRPLLLGGAAVVLVAAAAALLAPRFFGRKDRATPAQIRAEIAALEKERELLRARVDELIAGEPRIEGMPKTPVRVAVPTALARELIEKVTTGFVDQVTLVLKNLELRKSGTVKKVVTIGSYDLDVNIDEVRGQLKTAKPDVRFGGNRVTLALPITVASGSGQATIRFRWDGKNVAGAACGDLEVEQVVTGKVKPNRYPVQGTLVLSASAGQILASPSFPLIKVKLEIEPSPESWAAVQKILDSKRSGACGFALDRIDVLKIVQGIVSKGFDVRLPTEKIKPMAVPVGIEPTMNVRGRTVALDIRIGGLAITEHTLWLGANVAVRAPGAAVADTKGAAPAARAPSPAVLPAKAAAKSAPAS